MSDDDLPENQDSWNEYHKLILHELTRHGEELKGLQQKIDDLRTKDLPSVRLDINTLKVELSVRSGIWGGIAGLIPVLIAIGIKLI